MELILLQAVGALKNVQIPSSAFNQTNKTWGFTN